MPIMIDPQFESRILKIWYFLPEYLRFLLIAIEFLGFVNSQLRITI